MNNKVADLSQRLHNAIDSNYNVTDMAEFVSVIEALEGTTVTKEVLETTRMAKHINEVRRRTRFVPLARRVKLLLKKWRSTVLPAGSDNSSSNVVAMSNENVANAVSKQQRYPLSQSTSPTGAMTFATNSTPSTVTSATRSANLNVHNYNMKRLENAEGSNRACSSTSAVPKDCGRQPTSFANLIPDFNNTKSISTTDTNYNRMSTTGRKSNTPYSMNTRTYDIINNFYDQSALSSIDAGDKSIQYSTVLEEPIVIDIQDSNSGSNIIFAAEQTLTNSNLVGQPTPPLLKKAAGVPLKPKKIKKEKKRKDRESQNDKSPLLIQHFHNSTGVDGNSQPLVHPPNVAAEDIFSISNSSMNSMFAGETIPKGTSNDTFKSRRPLPKLITTPTAADLSFAGKFQTQRNSSLTAPTGFDNATEFHSGIDSDRSQTSTAKVDFSIVKPVSENVTNSNDSSSCSRVSQFDPGVIVNEVRLQQPSASNVARMPRVDLAAVVLTPPLNVVSVSPAVVPSEAVAPSSNASTANQEKKIPKKRGRKKGSKGVDSVIAKEASLSSQMLISSLGAGAKKVKTTKELYAEMQNRKFGFSNPNSTTGSFWGVAPQQLPLHAETSCSDSSDAFAKNTTTAVLNNQPTSINLLTAIDESSSESSAPSIASGKRARRISVESNSNSQLPISKGKSSEQGPTPPDAVAAIEEQLQEILKDLPAPPSLKEIELECAADLVPCSCIITEVPSEQITEDFAQASPEDRSGIITDEVKSSERTQADFTANKTINELQQLPQNKTNLEEPTEDESPPPIKSIFDLDYDEEDDPLNTLFADVCKTDSQTSSKLYPSTRLRDEKDVVGEDKIKQREVQRIPAEEEDLHSQHVLLIPTVTVTAPSPTPVSEIPLFSTFKVEEDPECVAKIRFELQTQKITEFHINALHNCYIPNINGNWDHTNELNTNLLTADRSASSDFVNVVPKYGMFEDDYIPKDLSKVSFTKNFKPKKRTAEMDALVDLPFLGSARLSFIRKNRVKCKHKHKKIVKIKNDGGAEDGDRTCSLNLLHENEKTVETVMESKDKPHLAVGLEDTNPPNRCAESFITSNTVNSYLNNEMNTDTDTAGINNNNNELLKDISIDIADAMPNYQFIPGDVNAGILKNSTPQSQNLLTTVDNHHQPYKLVVMGTDNACPYKDSTNNGEDFVQAITATLSYANKESGTVAAVMNVNNSATEGEMDDNASSRYSISSHCSKSSLKDIQHSINLKLRRRTTNSNERKRQKHSSKKSDVDTDDEPPPKKRSRIKRIKIAINGDIATQRQISVGSSNNSSDYGNSDEDNGSDNSNATRSSTFEDNELYTVIDDDQDAGDGDNEDDGSDNNIDDEEYGEIEESDVDGDADGEEDDDEDYTGEYHEVVTRDISAPSTNNNHIVLTIKKTPSKTNSPSNSVSAISPILTSVTKSASANEKIALSAKESSQFPAEAEPESESKTVSVAVPAPSPAALKPARELSIEVEEGQLKKDNSTTSKSIELPSTSNVYANIDTASSPFPPAADPGILLDRRRCRLRRLRRRTKPIQTFVFPDDVLRSTSPTRLLNRKRHRQLFFYDEINVRVDHNLRDKVLNISSCSSSCGEESEYEHYTSEDEEEAKNDPKKVKNLKILKPSCKNSTHNEDSSPPIKSANTNSASAASSSTFSDTQTESDDSDDKTARIEAIEETPSVRKSDDQDSPDDLPTENNGLLLSFNNIYQTSDRLKAYDDNDSNEPDQGLKVMTEVEAPSNNINRDRIIRKQKRNKTKNKQTQQQQEALKQQLPNENCDDYNNPYNNNNNFNLIKFDKSNLELNCMYKNGRNQQLETETNAETQIDQLFSTTSKQLHTDLVPHKEYQTGLRAVDEDVHDEQGNNCARIQQFKEWHQTLRLRSYNEELLTVLPYVVLDF